MGPLRQPALRSRDRASPAQHDDLVSTNDRARSFVQMMQGTRIPVMLAVLSQRRVTRELDIPSHTRGPMQRFNAPLSAEDHKFYRRIARIMLIAYSSVALVLTAGVAAHLVLKTPTMASAPVDVATKPGTSISLRE